MPFGSLAGNSCKIVWKNDQSAKERSVDDIYVPIPNEQVMTHDDLPGLEDFSDEDDTLPIIAPCPEEPRQLGSKPEVIKDSDLVVYRKHLGWCVVLDGRTIPLSAFMRGPLRKPSTEIQEKAAFESLSLIVRRGPEAKDVDSSKADGGAALADGE